MDERGQPKKRTFGDRIVVAVMVVVIAWALYVVVKSMLFPPELLPPTLAGQDLGAIDLDWRVQRLGGEPMDMSSVKGNVVVLNFWEHWCPPCRDEMASIQRLYEAVKDRGVLVMPVFQQEPDATRQFLLDRQITMPVYQVLGALPGDVAPGSIPTTYILNRGGHAVAVQVGAARWDDPSVVEFLKGLVGK